MKKNSITINKPLLSTVDQCFMQDPTHLIPICKLVIGETFTISIVNVLPPKNIVDHLIPIAFWEMTNVTSVCHNL